MPVDFLTNFGLNENAFHPTRCPEGVRRRLWRGLNTSPLRIYAAPALRELFIPAAGSFRNHIDEFNRRMRGAGYSRTEASDGGQSLTVIIRGPKGSGKTTLANYLAAETKEYKLPVPFAWKVVDLLDEDAKDLNPVTIRERIAVTVERAFQVDVDGFGCVLFDAMENVGQPSEADNDLFLAAQLERLRRDRVFVTLITVGDKSQNDFWKRSELIGGQDVDLTLDYLNPTQAVEFVKGRIKVRRDQGSIPWAEDVSLATFPFVECQIQKTIMWNMLEDRAGVKASIAIGNLNKILAEVLQLENEARATSEVDVRRLPAHEVAGHTLDLIKRLEQMYDRATARAA